MSSKNDSRVKHLINLSTNVPNGNTLPRSLADGQSSSDMNFLGINVTGINLTRWFFCSTVNGISSGVRKLRHASPLVANCLVLRCWELCFDTAFDANA